MVHVRDEGAVLEATVDDIWRFLPSAAHGPAHRSVRHRTTRPEGENVVIASMERLWNGAWVKVVNRLTLYPPLGYVVEALEGPFAGSRSMTVYTPQGSRTRIDVFGEFVSPDIPASELEAAARRWLEETYDEDAPALRAFAGTA